MFREHFTGLCYFAQKYLGDLDSSKEIVHDVFVRLWENRDAFDFDKPAKSYLFTSVYNRSMNHIRDQKKFMHSDDPQVNADIVDDGEFADNLEVSELEAKIKQSLDELPGKCKDVFLMNRFEGKKYAEIAEDLGISVKTVEAHMSKALKLLKHDLQDYLYIFLLLILKNNNFI